MNTKLKIALLLAGFSGAGLYAGSKVIPGTTCKNYQDCQKHAGICYSKEYGFGHLYDNTQCNRNGICECYS